LPDDTPVGSAGMTSVLSLGTTANQLRQWFAPAMDISACTAIAVTVTLPACNVWFLHKDLLVKVITLSVHNRRTAFVSTKYYTDFVRTFDIFFIYLSKARKNCLQIKGLQRHKKWRFMKNRGPHKTEKIEIRISCALKDALESFSRRNLQTTSEAVTHAIKEFIGFGQNNPPKRKIGKNTPDKNKTGRLQIRIHPRLKKEFYQFCYNSGIKKKTIALTEAIRLYIGSIPDTISNRKRAGY
jgi:hypothetical protein